MTKYDLLKSYGVSISLNVKICVRFRRVLQVTSQIDLLWDLSVAYLSVDSP